MSNPLVAHLNKEISKQSGRGNQKVSIDLKTLVVLTKLAEDTVTALETLTTRVSDLEALEGGGGEISPQNLLEWSNIFNNYGAWGQDGGVDRTQQNDGSWDLDFTALSTIFQIVDVVALTDYTFSIELKSVPAGCHIRVLNLSFATMVTRDVSAEVDDLTLQRISIDFTTIAAQTGVYLALYSPIIGSGLVRHAQLTLNDSEEVKPYVQTYGIIEE